MTDAERDCRVAAPDGTMRCTFQGCKNRGVPDAEFPEFFMCGECGERLEQLLWLEHAKHHAGRN